MEMWTPKISEQNDICLVMESSRCSSCNDCILIENFYELIN